MTDGRSFQSLQEASRFMETEIDRRATSRIASLDNGFELRVSPHTFGDGRFTNVYDLSWDPGNAEAAVHFSSRPTEAVETAQGTRATTTAGFFVLADEFSGLPPQTSLNLAIDQGRVLSLPVVDREAMICRDGNLSMQHISAEGRVAINGNELSWAGSRTGHAAQSYVYGNGNIVIARRTDPVRGRMRVLDEESRRTPAMPADDGWVDVGFRATAGGGFRSEAIAPEGGMDIFAYDVVMRCQAHYIDPHRSNTMDIRSVGSLHADAFPDFAVTVGPSLDVPDFAAHSINRDPSLGDNPPLADARTVRMVLYQDPRGRTHLRLFDGRPGSPSFQGATPTEARDAIAADTGYRWGCFLDGGGTAKMWVMEDGALTSYGNRHYLRWPKQNEDQFTWVPDIGRPVSSVITFQQRGPDLDRSLTAARVASLSFPQGRKSPVPPAKGIGQVSPDRPPRSSSARDQGDQGRHR